MTAQCEHWRTVAVRSVNQATDGLAGTPPSTPVRAFHDKEAWARLTEERDRLQAALEAAQRQLTQHATDHRRREVDLEARLEAALAISRELEGALQASRLRSSAEERKPRPARERETGGLDDAAVRASFDELQERLSSAESELRVQHARCAKAEHCVGRLEQLVATSQADLERATETHAVAMQEARNEVQRLRTQNDALEQQAADLRDQLESMRSQWASLQDERCACAGGFGTRCAAQPTGAWLMRAEASGMLGTRGTWRNWRARWPDLRRSWRMRATRQASC